MIEFVTYLALFLLAAFTAFQIALICGAPIGRFAWGGQHNVLPAKLRIGSAVAIVLYLLFALLLADRAGLVDIVSDSVAHIGVWVVTVYLMSGILLNGISRSKPERFVMTPVTLVLAMSFLVVALS